MEPTALGELAVWAGAACPEACKSIVIDSVSTDTRTLKPGALFTALRGERFDGHDYVRQAESGGAAALLVDRPIETNLPCLRVNDTGRAYLAMAGGYRGRFNIPIAALTGSVGKTTAKEMTASILSSRYKTFKTPENHNNAVGVAQALLSLDSTHEAAVFELGMNHAGEISPMSLSVQPDVAAIVNVGVMHMEYLGSREAIAAAKCEIFDGLKTGGTAIIDGDAPLLQGVVDQSLHHSLRFGLSNPHNEFTAADITAGADGVSFKLLTPEEVLDIRLPVPGKHNVICAMAAAAAGWVMGVSGEGIVSGLAGFRNTGMRMNIFSWKGITIMEDCYNAGPESMAAALAVMAGRPETGKRIAVLGGMRELGPVAREAHETLGRIAAKNADALFLYGEYMELCRDSALAAGMNPQNAQLFASHEELAEALRPYAQTGDVLLFKGSRGMRMERVLTLFKGEVSHVG